MTRLVGSLLASLSKILRWVPDVQSSRAWLCQICQIQSHWLHLAHGTRLGQPRCSGGRGRLVLWVYSRSTSSPPRRLGDPSVRALESKVKSPSLRENCNLERVADTLNSTCLGSQTNAFGLWDPFTGEDGKCLELEHSAKAWEGVSKRATLRLPFGPRLKKCGSPR